MIQSFIHTVVFGNRHFPFDLSRGGNTSPVQPGITLSRCRDVDRACLLYEVVFSVGVGECRKASVLRV